MPSNVQRRVRTAAHGAAASRASAAPEPPPPAHHPAVCGTPPQVAPHINHVRGAALLDKHARAISLTPTRGDAPDGIRHDVCSPVGRRDGCAERAALGTGQRVTVGDDRRSDETSECRDSAQFPRTGNSTIPRSRPATLRFVPTTVWAIAAEEGTVLVSG